jgi:hypothetical protein
MGVVLAPVPRRHASHPNWHAAFTTGGRGAVPRIAWRIGADLAAQFDLATSDRDNAAGLRPVSRLETKHIKRPRTTSVHVL